MTLISIARLSWMDSCRPPHIGHDAAHCGGGQENDLGPVGGQPFFHLNSGVKGSVMSRAAVRISQYLGLEAAHNGATRHAAMARDPDLCRPGRRNFQPLLRPCCITRRSLVIASRTSSLKLVSAVQPSTRLALEGSPCRKSTSVGRK